MAITPQHSQLVVSSPGSVEMKVEARRAHLGCTKTDPEWRLPPHTVSIKLSFATFCRATTTASHAAAKMKTQWKDIPVVPTSQEFLDIVLSRTQRRLPTQVRFLRKSREAHSTYTDADSCGLQDQPYSSLLHS